VTLSLEGVVDGLDATGVYTFRTVDGRSTGPLACAADWQAAWEGLGLAPRGGRPAPLMEVTVQRPCPPAERFEREQSLAEWASEVAEANSVWHAFRLGLRAPASLLVNEARGQQVNRVAVNNALVTAASPPGTCEDTSTIVIDARQQDTLGLTLFGSHIGTLRVSSDAAAVDVAPDLSNWNSALFPHGTPLTVTVTNPCVDPGQRYYFNAETLWTAFENGETLVPEFRATYVLPDQFYAVETETFLYLDDATVASYEPPPADCVDTETIVIQGNRYIAADAQ